MQFIHQSFIFKPIFKGLFSGGETAEENKLTVQDHKMLLDVSLQLLLATKSYQDAS